MTSAATQTFSPPPPPPRDPGNLASYYASGNYTDYLERGPRYAQIARELDALFTSLSLVTRTDSVLDYGCGVGFLASAFKALGYVHVTGSDSSEWALAQAASRGVLVTPTVPRAHVLLALDVFEHMRDAAVRDVLDAARAPVLVARIPVAEVWTGADRFHLACSRRDLTHVNCKLADAWEALFARAGYATRLRLNLHTLYTSPGVLCVLALRARDTA